MDSPFRAALLHFAEEPLDLPRQPPSRQTGAAERCERVRLWKGCLLVTPDVSPRGGDLCSVPEPPGEGVAALPPDLIVPQVQRLDPGEVRGLGQGNCPAVTDTVV